MHTVVNQQLVSELAAVHVHACLFILRSNSEFFQYTTVVVLLGVRAGMFRLHLCFSHFCTSLQFTL